MKAAKPREVDRKKTHPGDPVFVTALIRGKVEITVLDEYERVQEKRIIKNLVTDIGDALIAEMMANNGLSEPISHLAVGDGTTAPTKGDTQLENELTRETVTVQQESGATDNTVRFEAMWPVGGAQGSYTEAGLFNADTAGSMFSRTVFTQIDVGPADTLLVRWYIEFLGA